MRKRIYPLLCLLSAGLWGSCMRSEDFNTDMFADSSFNYDVAIPLTSTKLTMENLIDLKGGLFVPDDTSLLHIIYTVKPVKAELIKDVNLGQVAPFVVSTPTVTYMCLKDTLITVPFTDTVFFDIEGMNAQVKTLYFSSLQMAVRSDNRFIFPMEMEMNFDNIIGENGQKMVYRNNTQAKANHDTVVDMRNVRLQMDEAQQPFVVLSGSIKVNVKRTPGDSALYTGTMYSTASFKEMNFQRADGYLDSTAYKIEGSMSIAGFGLERMTNIDFEDASLIADVKVEGVSAPLRLKNSKVLIHNMEGEASVIPLFPENYDVACPAITDNPLAKESRESAGIVDILIDRPYMATYVLDGLLNPEHDKSQLQAIEKGGNMSVGLTCDIPLRFSADSYALCDTLEVSLDDLDENTEVSYFDVKSIVKNAFPLDLTFSLHFLDAGYNNLFSLFHDDLIAGGKVGPAPGLHVVEPTVARFEDVLDIAEMAKARRMHYVVVDAKIGTTDGQKVKVYVDGEREGYAEVKVGVRVKIKQKGLLTIGE
ncbi:MAG: hypothetical protein NC048_01585 [Bacteroides sp.]|nr:hypothetical protein [Bacteroides sp.]MCM1530754.1 hypothetical protein [Ruminococcus flavefaciens]MCM1554172.1 hypothetical protein [Bacteroides sp.]